MTTPNNYRKRKLNIKELLCNYHKPVVHMYQKKQDNELMLCLGAGASRHWEIPNWSELIQRISMNQEIDGQTIFESNLSLTSKVQALFEHYKNKCSDSLDSTHPFYDDVVRMSWIKLIHKELYKSKSTKGLDHPYLYEYLEIIRKSPITINYNFDNFIEQILRKENENISGSYASKEFESTDKPSVNFKLNKGVIYHPNGCLPEELEESIGGHFVFSEKSFQDQLLESMMGHYSPLMYFYSRYTALFIGVSLEDQNLRHMLRQTAVVNPGHYHYYIFYKDPQNFKLSPEDMKAIQESYFDTFNLIVLFLDNDGIKQLGECLNMEKNVFSNLLRGNGLSPVLNYYISGAPGTGKTSALRMLMDFKIYDEWPGPDVKHRNLDKEDTLLSPEEREELDDWITEKFRLKNSIVSEGNRCIQLIDRSPLDPITYAASSDLVQKRATDLSNSFNQTESDIPLVNGHVIILTANAESVYQRLNKRNPNQYKQDWSDEKIKHFKQLYDKEDVTVVQTSYRSIAEVTKKLAHIIFFDKYRPIDLNKYLKDYCEGTRSITISDDE